MKDAEDTIIYIGKAINLKNRVRQYFQPSSQEYPKTKNLAARIKEFEYIVTDTELEALVLECNLIKLHKPKYNILLKDDKTYPYLKLTVNEDFPRLFITRLVTKDKAKYYGPYSSAILLRETINIIHKIWKLRTCSRRLPRDIGKERPCLNHHIGNCKAPCNGKFSKEEYGKIIEEVEHFLSGKQDNVIKHLTEKMNEYSENMQFEEAAEERDKIYAIKALQEKQKTENTSQTDQDIVALARGGEEALVQVFFVRSGKMLGREHFMLSCDQWQTNEDILAQFIKQFYGETTFIPREIIIENEIGDRELIEKWLTQVKGSGVQLTVPKKGEKVRLVQLASKNAQVMLTQFGEKLKKDKERTEGAIEELKMALNCDFDLNRIEAYDISNTSGVLSVGTMVVFEGGRKKPSDYRKFRIRGVLGPNDYASMEEVIIRRFMRYKNEEEKFIKLPDCIFVDGGQGHISAVEKALNTLSISIPVCGMVKDDNHRTRGLIYNGREIYFSNQREAFNLIIRIQDEVHRFAITYHRKLRESNQIKSVLDDIKGIGEARRKALINHFGDIDKIKEADFDSLLQVKGMNKKAAEAVINFFSEQNKE